MGLIIGRKLRELKVGYPTISDKYDVAPAVVDSAETGTIAAGDIVIFGSETGRYKKFVAGKAVADIAGVCLATNVKVPHTYPANSDAQEYVAGEAFNLCFKGAFAVPVDLGNKTVADFKEGAGLAVVLTGTGAGKLTVHGATVATVEATDIPDCIFTGVIENHGTAAAPKYVAEVLYKIV